METFDTDKEITWCPGCGNFAILKAMKKAFTSQGLAPKDLLLVAGIGQAGKTPHYIQGNLLHGLHGRALAMATGAKIANHNLNIVVNSGDGDCYGEGGNHFLAAIRRNVDLTLLVHNNQVYGLTKGQASPTSPLGMKTKLQAHGTTSPPFNPIAMALTAGAGFVAKGFSGNLDQLSGLIVAAMSYKGFAMIDILQPCVSFNKINTHLWYKERVFDLVQQGHDVTNFQRALALSLMDEEKIPTGIIYKKKKSCFHEKLAVLKHMPLVEYPFAKGQIGDILSQA